MTPHPSAGFKLFSIVITRIQIQKTELYCNMTPCLVTNKILECSAKSYSLILCWTLLSPKSDQQKFSPNDIRTFSRDKVMRTNKMIPNEKIPRSFIKFPQLILKGNVWRSVWRLCMWILGLKGLNEHRVTEVVETKCVIGQPQALRV